MGGKGQASLAGSRAWNAVSAALQRLGGSEGWWRKGKRSGARARLRARLAKGGGRCGAGCARRPGASEHRGNAACDARPPRGAAALAGGQQGARRVIGGGKGDGR